MVIDVGDKMAKAMGGGEPQVPARAAVGVEAAMELIRGSWDRGQPPPQTRQIRLTEFEKQAAAEIVNRWNVPEIAHLISEMQQDQATLLDRSEALSAELSKLADEIEARDRYLRVLTHAVGQRARTDGK